MRFFISIVSFIIFCCGLFFSFENIIHAADIRVIYQVDLSYDQALQPQLSIDNINMKTGFLSIEEVVTEENKIELLNLSGDVLYSQKFNIPNEVSGPPPLPGEEASGDSVILNKVKFSLNLPYYFDATSIRVIIENTTISKNISQAKVNIVETKPKSSSVNSREVNNDGFAQLSTSSEYLDIAIVASGYSNMTAFHADVDKIIKHALTYEPLKSRAGEINFHSIDNSVDLGCAYDSTITRLLSCNNTFVTSVVNNSGVPNDITYVLVNNQTYGGSGGKIAVGYNGFYIGPMFVHESIGHGLGRLMDEYNLYSTNGYIDNNIHSLAGTSGGNCYAGQPPASVWEGVVQQGDYRKGCYYPNWYRSSPSSIMIQIDTPYFNNVGQNVITRKMNALTGRAVPGDGNKDGYVDIFDLDMWYSHYLNNTSNGGKDGDYDNSGKVDGIDYIIWLNNYEL